MKLSANAGESRLCEALSPDEFPRKAGPATFGDKRSDRIRMSAIRLSKVPTTAIVVNACWWGISSTPNLFSSTCANRVVFLHRLKAYVMGFYLFNHGRVFSAGDRSRSPKCCASQMTFTFRNTAVRNDRPPSSRAYNGRATIPHRRYFTNPE